MTSDRRFWRKSDYMREVARLEAEIDKRESQRVAQEELIDQLLRELRDRAVGTCTESMKSLDEWNAERLEAHRRANEYPRPNGIACPDCGAELLDTNAIVLTSYPPKANVHCAGCGWHGYRVR